MIIAIDFDGTIVEDNYPEIGKLKQNADLIIQELKKDGHFIIIWTCRANKSLQEAVDFLRKNQIPFDSVNSHEPQNILSYGVGAVKVYADVYIDNNQVGGLPRWDDIYHFIHQKQGEMECDKVREDCNDFGKSPCGLSEGADMYDSSYCWKCCW